MPENLRKFNKYKILLLSCKYIIPSKCRTVPEKYRVNNCPAHSKSIHDKTEQNQKRMDILIIIIQMLNINTHKFSIILIIIHKKC